MPREKKDGRYINYYIEKSIYKKLEKYCEITGQTKTIAIERILEEYIENYFKSKNDIKAIFNL